MVKQWRSKLAQWIAPQRAARMPQIFRRAYNSAQNSRLTAGFGTSNSSADSELVQSLQTLRSRSRQLVRDSAFAKRAKVIVVNNVIGPGMGMQACVRTTRDTLAEPINEAIEEGFEEWSRADSCHTGGALHFADFERAAFGAIFEAGEVFIRKHRRPFGKSSVPFALELIEPERLADDYAQPGPIAPGAQVRMGVEVDQFFRPIAYWIRNAHPSEIRFTGDSSIKLERVPAEDIFHLRLIDRWPQTRGEPWMHAVIRKLNDIDGYTEAEIIAARSAAAYMGFIESPDADNPNFEEQDDGTLQTELSPGVIERLNPGEKFNFATPNRPNSQAETFLRFMLREMAAGTGCSYESLSRDYSQSNYSSSRLALLDDRDLWKTYQLWWMRAFRCELHREWLQAATLAGALSIPVGQYAADPSKFEDVKFKPRGWSWIDPTKEVEAYTAAIKAGLTTQTDVIANTANGQDIEDIFETRARELQMAEDMGLKFDTSPDVFDKPDPVASAPPAKPPVDKADATDQEDPPARVFSISRTVK